MGAKTDPDRTGSGGERSSPCRQNGQIENFLVTCFFSLLIAVRSGLDLNPKLNKGETQVHTPSSSPTVSSASLENLGTLGRGFVSASSLVPFVLVPPWDASSESTATPGPATTGGTPREPRSDVGRAGCSRLRGPVGPSGHLRHPQPPPP